MTLHEWAIQWSIPLAALQDLQQRMGHAGTQAMEAPQARHAVPGSEGAVSNLVRLEASRKGVHLFRNNVGVLMDMEGRPVRFGLANDSKRVNEVIKSGDLIGLRPRLIGPQDVGYVIGQFVSREVKAPGWRYANTEREQAQQRWIDLVLSVGGDAAFTNGEGSL